MLLCFGFVAKPVLINISGLTSEQWFAQWQGIPCFLSLFCLTEYAGCGQEIGSRHSQHYWPKPKIYSVPYNLILWQEKLELRDAMSYLLCMISFFSPFLLSSLINLSLFWPWVKMSFLAFALCILSPSLLGRVGESSNVDAWLLPGVTHHTGKLILKSIIHHCCSLKLVQLSLSPKYISIQDMRSG